MKQVPSFPHDLHVTRVKRLSLVNETRFQFKAHWLAAAGATVRLIIQRHQRPLERPEREEGAADGRKFCGRTVHRTGTQGLTQRPLEPVLKDKSAADFSFSSFRRRTQWTALVCTSRSSLDRWAGGDFLFRKNARNFLAPHKDKRLISKREPNQSVQCCCASV